MRLFVSYAHKDKRLAYQLIEIIRQGGHEPWIDVEQLRTGKEWKKELQNAIRNSDAFLMAITPAWMKSKNCQWEFVEAVEQGKRIIPVVLRETILPDRIAKYQFADFRRGSRDLGNQEKLQRFLNDLLSIAITITTQDIKEIPKKKLENDIAKALRLGEWTPYGIIMLLVALIAVIPVIHEYWDEIIFWKSTPIIPMPNDGKTLNVALAGFVAYDQDHSENSKRMAKQIDDTVYEALSQIDGINLRGPKDGVEPIACSDTEVCESKAAKIAHAWNAHVVIYGVVKQTTDEMHAEFEPIFFIEIGYTSLEPDFSGATAIGGPIQILLDSIGDIKATPELQGRIRILLHVLKGLENYLNGDFSGSRMEYDLAIQEVERVGEIDQQIEGTDKAIFYVFAGNASIREPDIKQALAYYDKALKLKPNYPRALVGKGITLFLSIQSKDFVYDPSIQLSRYDTCSQLDEPATAEPQWIAMLSIKCQEQALNLVESPDPADVDIKATFQLGQVKFWLAQKNAPLWQEANQHFSQVIVLYNTSSVERQNRTHAYAAYSYGYMAYIIVETTSYDNYSVELLSKALNYCQNAISLLEKAGMEKDIPNFDGLAQEIKIELTDLQEQATSEVDH